LSTRARDLIRGGLTAVVVLAGWEALARSRLVPIALFPPPSAVLKAGVGWWNDGELLRDVGTSFWRATVGYLLGALAGLGLGLLTGRMRALDLTLRPILQALRPLPPVAIVPLIIVWMGIGNGAKLFSIAFAVFFPVWVATHLGAQAVPDGYTWTAKILGASRSRIFFLVILPSAMSVAASGLRTAVSMAFVMVFVSELAGASEGLGYQIATSHLAYRIDRMMAALALLAGLGVLTDAAVARALGVLMPWRRGARLE
jgi:ABC-type nitrate/sulfonate/bicarbonate transport system permease component